MFKVKDELIVEKLSRLTSVDCGPCPVFCEVPWHLPYNSGKKHGNTSVKVVEKCKFGHDSLCQHGRLAGSHDKLSIPMSLL
jgi:hypothetical protein